MSMLESLTVTEIMAEANLHDELKGLVVLVKRINTLSPQAPQQFQSNAYKVRCLRRAVLS